jgi:hypothetical protein
MRFRCAMALCVLVATMQSGLLAADDAPAPPLPPGWMGDADYAKALASAKEKGQPLAIFFTYGSKTKYFGRGKEFGTYVLAQPGLKSMVRVIVFAEKTPDFLQDFRGKMGDTTGFMPQLYLLDPKGNIAGFAAKGDRALVVKAIKAANDLATWLKKSDRLLQAAEKSVADARYGTALSTLDQIEREDRKMTAAIAAVVPQNGSAATQPTADLSNPFARPGDDDIKKVDSQPQALPPGKYYADAISAKRTEYDAAAAQRLQTAQEAFDRKQFAEAKRLLNPMVEDRANFDVLKRAADLLKKAEAAERAASKDAAN